MKQVKIPLKELKIFLELKLVYINGEFHRINIHRYSHSIDNFSICRAQQCSLFETSQHDGYESSQCRYSCILDKYEYPKLICYLVRMKLGFGEVHSNYAVTFSRLMHLTLFKQIYLLRKLNNLS